MAHLETDRKLDRRAGNDGRDSLDDWQFLLFCYGPLRSRGAATAGPKARTFGLPGRITGAAGNTAVLHQRLHDFNYLRAQSASTHPQVLARWLSLDVVVLSGSGNRDGGYLFGGVADRMGLGVAQRTRHSSHGLVLQYLLGTR